MDNWISQAMLTTSKPSNEPFIAQLRIRAGIFDHDIVRIGKEDERLVTDVSHTPLRCPPSLVMCRWFDSVAADGMCRWAECYLQKGEMVQEKFGGS